MFVVQGNAVITQDQQAIPPPAAIGHGAENTRSLERTKSGTLERSKHGSRSELISANLRDVQCSLASNGTLGLRNFSDALSLEAHSLPKLKIEQAPYAIPVVADSRAVL